MLQQKDLVKSTVYIELETIKRLTKYKVKSGVSLAHIVRKGIEMYMSTPEFKKIEKG